MRLKSILAVAAGIGIVGFLGFRVVDLEQRLVRISEQVRASAATPLQASTPAGKSKSLVTSNVEERCEQRLVALERRINELSWPTQLPSCDPATRLSNEQAILSVMERENSRIRDVQLEWHRGRWLEGREYQLQLFASQQQLSASQTDAVRKALERETDAMISVLKRPELAEDPDQAAAEWMSLLHDTDMRAAKVLTPEQLQAWNFARSFERHALWPWLPEQASTQR